MKKMKFSALLLSIALILGGCNANNTVKGGAIGAGSGAALGAIIGGIAGKGKGAAIGAAIGTAVGGGAGAIIGNKMDKKAKQAAEIEGAEVEQVTDTNGLQAVKVTFNSGILFGFNSSTLSASAKSSLSEFSKILREDPTIDIAVVGHTDKVGSYEANQTVSTRRANAVADYLKQNGVAYNQFQAVQGVGYDQYDESASAEQNRRVDVYMYASEQMIKNAEAGK
ncbi:OmpA family protein [Bacteroides sp. 51]|uniref:OmpA family protein n=1 Tax=Bacteroides sp. 51 TaxID=2302938 RepID=UPI0013D38BEC|nr:OmpA family protein [Bacteroides sp. 51]NDV81953.1 OmpA family protein [Bacteroides sp. 51]